MTCCPFDITPDTEQKLKKNWNTTKIRTKIKHFVLKTEHFVQRVEQIAIKLSKLY